VTFVASLGGAVVLAWLARTRFSRTAVWAAIGVLPLLVLISPSRLELGVTILVEAPIVWALASALGLDRWQALLASGFVNTITQPSLYFALQHFSSPGVLRWRLTFAGCELAVWIAEALLYLACLESLRRARGRVGKALAISLAANAASAILGLLLPI
jgi:hypothetical protein